MVVLEKCTVSEKQCHAIAHGLRLSNKVSIKILRLINITNTDKKTDGFGDKLLSQIIRKLD